MRGSLGSSPGDTSPARPQFHLCSARGLEQVREWGLGLAVPGGNKRQRARQGGELAQGGIKEGQTQPNPHSLPSPPLSQCTPSEPMGQV